MIGSNAKEVKTKKSTATYNTDGRYEAYFKVLLPDGHEVWYVDGLQALNAYNGAGDKARLYCGRSPNTVQRIR